MRNVKIPIFKIQFLELKIRAKIILTVPCEIQRGNLITSNFLNLPINKYFKQG